MTEKQVKSRLALLLVRWRPLTGLATFHPGDLDPSGQPHLVARVAADGF